MKASNTLVNIRGARLAIRDSRTGGSAAPFIWGHCLLGSMAQDDEASLLQWDNLARKVRLLRYDVRGHGASAPCRIERAFHFSELSKDIISLADHQGLSSFALGGVSLGSALALHTALAEPKRVKALVLMAPPTAWEMRRRQASLYLRIAMGIRMGGLIPLQLLAALSRFRGGLESIPDDDLPASVLARSTVLRAGRMDRRSVVAAFHGAAASNIPSPSELRKIKQPTLILAWHNDSSHPAATADRLEKLLPHSELHYAHDMSEARQWTTRVQAFINKHR